MKNPITLTPGVYEITEAVEPIYKDKRVKSDWRYQPVKKGTKFSVWVECPGEPWAYLAIRDLFAYDFEKVRLDEVTFADKLVPVTSLTAHEHLARIHGRSYPGAPLDVLDWLVANGRLTTDEIDSILAEIADATFDNDDDDDDD